VAIGAIGEDGHICLNEMARTIPGVNDDYIAAEPVHQRQKIDRRKRLFQSVGPAAPL